MLKSNILDNVKTIIEDEQSKVSYACLVGSFSLTSVKLTAFPWKTGLQLLKQTIVEKIKTVGRKAKMKLRHLYHINVTYD